MDLMDRFTFSNLLDCAVLPRQYYIAGLTQSVRIHQLRAVNKTSDWGHLIYSVAVLKKKIM
jgi:hypothetical protein